MFPFDDVIMKLFIVLHIFDSGSMTNSMQGTDKLDVYGERQWTNDFMWNQSQITVNPLV